MPCYYSLSTLILAAAHTAPKDNVSIYTVVRVRVRLALVQLWVSYGLGLGQEQELKKTFIIQFLL